MRKGYIRASGGRLPDPLSLRTSLSSMSRMRKPSHECSLTRSEIRELRKRLRDAINFYRAQKPNSVKYAKRQKDIHRARLYARRLAAKPDSELSYPELSPEILSYSPSVGQYLA